MHFHLCSSRMCFSKQKTFTMNVEKNLHQRGSKYNARGANQEQSKSHAGSAVFVYNSGRSTVPTSTTIFGKLDNSAHGQMNRFD